MTVEINVRSISEPGQSPELDIEVRGALCGDKGWITIILQRPIISIFKGVQLKQNLWTTKIEIDSK